MTQLMTHEIRCPRRWEPLNTLQAFLSRLFPTQEFKFVQCESASTLEYLETAQPIDSAHVWSGTIVSADRDVENAVEFFRESLEAG